MKIRLRQPDGTLGPLEDVFPNQIDETTLMMLEALAGQQEQITQLQEQIKELKGEEA
ncbi:hypothetical protein ACQKMD_11285 [Viridibacillus sp. NPDC096237]|uniref:hypothetical protein n=1 Tax=Viridibacillus sp. NPDC096237 TaxID=3390721 RepID=UPI003CFC31BA